MTAASIAPPPGISCSVAAECEVRPSEDARAVAAALSEVVPGVPVKSDGPPASDASSPASGRAWAAADGLGCLSRVAETVRSRSSQAAYLRCMLRNMECDGGSGSGAGSTWFYLNKQAAAAGRIALCADADESPLGPIRVTVRSSDIGAVIDWLAPGQLNKVRAACEKISHAP